MNFQEFIPLALRTESDISNITTNGELLRNILRLCIAAGNLADMLKKNIAYNKPIDADKWHENLRSVTGNSFNAALITTDNRIENPFVATKDSEKITVNPRMLHGILGSFTESTELVEALLKAIDNDNEWDFTNIGEEIADGQWYNAIMLDEMNIPMDELLDTVIKKLQARYPNKYSDESAINRDLVTERKILETGMNQ